jgi:ferredoxin--NADP+ reductase
MIFNTEEVLSIVHWNDTLMSFTTTRNFSFKFTAGQFVMLGLRHQSMMLTRAYSIASSPYENFLEFFSVKIHGGEFTSLLKNLSIGDTIDVSSKPTGNLMINQLNPGKRLFLLASGTGLAPFLSIIHDVETYERFETVYLIHSVRHTEDLAYAEYLKSFNNYLKVINVDSDHLKYCPVVTKDKFHYQNRVTLGMLDGSLYEYIESGIPSPESDRFMICGNTQFNRDIFNILTNYHFKESGTLGELGDFVYEKAYVEKR